MHGNRIWSPAPEILMSWTFRVRTLAQPLKPKTLEDMGRRNEIEHQQSMTHWHAFAGFHRPSISKVRSGRNPYDLNFSLWHSAPKDAIVHAIVHAMIAIHFSPKNYYKPTGLWERPWDRNPPWVAIVPVPSRACHRPMLCAGTPMCGTEVRRIDLRYNQILFASCLCN